MLFLFSSRTLGGMRLPQVQLLYVLEALFVDSYRRLFPLEKSHSSDLEPHASPGLSECERRNPKPPGKKTSNVHVEPCLPRASVKSKNSKPRLLEDTLAGTLRSGLRAVRVETSLAAIPSGGRVSPGVILPSLYLLARFFLPAQRRPDHSRAARLAVTGRSMTHRFRVDFER